MEHQPARRPDQDRDRAAVQRQQARPLGRTRPRDAIAAGTRVKVVHVPGQPRGWQHEFFATVSDGAAPEAVDQAHAEAGELCYRVDFDESQRDGDGGGPHRTARIWSRYLEVVPTLSSPGSRWAGAGRRLDGRRAVHGTRGQERAES